MTNVSGQAGTVQVATPPGASDSCVYLLHADRPHPVYGWQHYIGWTRDVDQRIADHQRGRGARVTREWRRAGIPFRLVRVWPGIGHRGERALQRVKGRNLCPVCSGGGGRARSAEAAADSLPSLSCSSAPEPGGAS